MTDHGETVRALTEQLQDAETLKHALEIGRAHV